MEYFDGQPQKTRKKIPRNVVAMGLVSLFNDISSEMIYPIVPIFLTTILAAPASAVGLIEGVAESTASLLKMISGWLSDRLKKRKIFVAAGYSLSAASKFLIGLAQTWPFVLFARFIDRLGKGTRTAARDALILESVEPENRGRAFGLHRSMDSAGAVIGPILALLLIYLYQNNFRLIFFLAGIPSTIGLIQNGFWIWFIFPLYGIYMALTDGVTKAYIAQMIPKEKAGTAFGAYLMSTGMCMFVSSFAAGLLWKFISPSAAFYFGALTSLIAVSWFIISAPRQTVR